MNAVDILSDVPLTNLDHREAQFVRAELIEKIDAAVAAEREACARVAEQKRAVGTAAEIACAMYHAEHIAAAIRARGSK